MGVVSGLMSAVDLEFSCLTPPWPTLPDTETRLTELCEGSLLKYTDTGLRELFGRLAHIVMCV